MNQKPRKSIRRRISYIITRFSNEDEKIVDFQKLTQFPAERCDKGKKRANRKKDAEQPDPNCEHLNEQIWKIDENPQPNLKDINQKNQLAENESLKVDQNNDSLNLIDQNGIFEIQDLNFGQSEASLDEDSFMFDDSYVDGQF